MHTIHVHIDLSRAGCFVWHLNITGTFLQHWQELFYLQRSTQIFYFYFKLNLNLLLKSVES